MFFQILNDIVRGRKIVGLVSLAFFVVALVYAIGTGHRYEAHALLLPPIESGGEGVLSGWMASLNLPGIVAPMTAGATSASVLADILQSRRLGEMIIKKLDLMKHLKTGNTEDALRELKARTKITVTETGLIRLGVRDRSPEYALEIARAYIAGLDSLNYFLQYTQAEQTRKFISGQLERYRAQLESVRREIARFQMQHNIVDFDEQVRGAIDVAADLKVRAVLAEIDRDIYREFARKDAVELQRKEAEYENLNKQLNMIMRGDSAGAVFFPLSRLPALVQRYAAMQRDLTVSERVYSYLLEKYEQTGIDQARTTPVVQVVDEPTLPQKPAGLSPAWFVVIVTAIGFLWICAMLAWWGWVSTRERSGDEQRAFDELRDAMRSDLTWLRRALGGRRHG
jgi:uncharacterized protein involved in exopolysaccharide biosynthesis